MSIPELFASTGLGASRLTRLLVLVRGRITSRIFSMEARSGSIKQCHTAAWRWLLIAGAADAAIDRAPHARRHV